LLPAPVVVVAPMGRQAQVFCRGMAEPRFLAVEAGQALRLVFLALLPAPVVVVAPMGRQAQVFCRGMAE
ncbi:hypothetical protein, partial [Klebsiella quasipneumoniae]|uniref:hypothetical protein n=1 Tax=Klebsiella quasipneumoniae TaxID=1463165 RepID=UPI002731A100